MIHFLHYRIHWPPVLQWVIFVFDLLIVFYIIYQFLILIRYSHARNLVIGLCWMFIIYLGSHFLGLKTLNWLLHQLGAVLLLLVIIIFQPELRRFLEQIGSSRYLFSPLLLQGKGRSAQIIKQVIRSVEDMVKKKMGALIVVEVGTDLTEYVKTGIGISGDISSDLLTALFWKPSPTHDGAVILREDKIVAAGCLLPLTEVVLKDRRLGTRHRAALGLSEITDAIIIIISEETGIISLAEQGQLTRYLTKEALETRLFNLYKEDGDAKDMPFFQWLKLFNITHWGKKKNLKEKAETHD